MHLYKPWEIGQFTIGVYIYTENDKPDFSDVADEKFAVFHDGRYNLPVVLTGMSKYWRLVPTEREDGNLTIYWKPTSYASEEGVIAEAVVDACALLEQLFNKAGFTNNSTRRGQVLQSNISPC